MKKNTTVTITEALTMGNWDRHELAVMFRISEEEVSGAQKEFDRLLNDQAISEEEFQDWCDKTDLGYRRAIV